jgi:ABC-type branched-subunit amino acid transport system ATPase component
MSPLLTVTDIGKRFRGLVAVDRVSFEVATGEIFAVIGPNGAGKTTLFNMIAGVLAPNTGTIMFAGERIDGLRRTRSAGVASAAHFRSCGHFPLSPWRTTSSSERCCIVKTSMMHASTPAMYCVGLIYTLSAIKRLPR